MKFQPPFILISSVSIVMRALHSDPQSEWMLNFFSMGNQSNAQCESINRYHHTYRIQDGLRPGVYDDLKLQFCLPDLDEILETQGLNKKTLLSLIQSEVVSIKLDGWSLIFVRMVIPLVLFLSSQQCLSST